ncbi:hypothetical protein [Embleya sp. NPDC020630]|uniref:hypothetical protein n=1 Tax=Embleya sp. NPDC020630 TaxID=3363979 RepID=UPI00378D734B
MSGDQPATFLGHPIVPGAFTRERCTTCGGDTAWSATLHVLASPDGVGGCTIGTARGCTTCDSTDEPGHDPG